LFSFSGVSSELSSQEAVMTYRSVGPLLVTGEGGHSLAPFQNLKTENNFRGKYITPSFGKQPLSSQSKSVMK
tara:strand:+ start:3229 stop:3444 length:216 start_codon:yes stop_codon:yes gene_type:complete